MRSNETAGFMAMKGAGYYSKATTGARDVINAATPADPVEPSTAWA